MKMKLKTLKDIEVEIDNWNKGVMSKDLRQEAINDIKEFQGMIVDCQMTGSSQHMSDKQCINCECLREKIGYIKWKNNLTEEDLK